jgi:hypothetical protein
MQGSIDCDLTPSRENLTPLGSDYAARPLVVFTGWVYRKENSRGILLAFPPVGQLQGCSVCIIVFFGFFLLKQGHPGG